MPFNAAKQSVLGRALPSLLVWDKGLLNAFLKLLLVIRVRVQLGLFNELAG